MSRQTQIVPFPLLEQDEARTGAGLWVAMNKLLEENAGHE